MHIDLHININAYIYDCNPHKVEITFPNNKKVKAASGSSMKDGE
jgi:hypothetical protein